jgi:hypothetical protein
MRPDMQYFDQDGTWVKPSGAIRADVVLQAGGGGAAMRGQLVRRPGKDGEIAVMSFPADDLPEVADITVGKGGRPGGQDGYVLVVTHLSPGTGEERAMAVEAARLDAVQSGLGTLAGALAAWQARAHDAPQPGVRQAANAAIGALDAMLLGLHEIRARLASQMRAFDDAEMERSAALLERIRRDAEARGE